MAVALYGTSVTAYTGVDLSTVALSMARRALRSVPCCSHFLHEDLMDVLATMHGRLLVFDPMLQEGETRLQFLARWWDMCRTQWTGLDEEESRGIHEHVDDDDYPESPSTLRGLGLTAGFRRVECLFTDSTGIYQLLRFAA